MLPPEEIVENVASVERVPRHILPDGVAREALLRLARAGRQVYCYASGGETLGTWCAWVDDLARVRPDKNGRVPLTEWATEWPRILVAIGAWEVTARHAE